MNLFKKTMIGAALALGIAASAQATTINIGGVIWDTDSTIDFSAASVAIYQTIVDGVLSGYGVITTLNGATSFCAASSCELTFTFGGYTASGATTTGTGVTATYTGGWVNVYVDSTPEAVNSDVTTMTLASTSDGALWLALTGHDLTTTTDATTLVGTGTTDADGDVSTLVGSGLLDVTGGLAATAFDTNTTADGSDLTFTNGFTTVLDTTSLTALGTGNFKGNTVPEPGSLALLGLGLFGLGTLRNRRRKA